MRNNKFWELNGTLLIETLKTEFEDFNRNQASRD